MKAQLPVDVYMDTALSTLTDSSDVRLWRHIAVNSDTKEVSVQYKAECDPCAFLTFLFQQWNIKSVKVEPCANTKTKEFVELCRRHNIELCFRVISCHREKGALEKVHQEIEQQFERGWKDNTDQTSSDVINGWVYSWLRGC